MADASIYELSLSAVTGTTTLRDAGFSTEGIRDLVISVEISASASGGSDTLAVTLQGTNTDLTTAGGSGSDNYWTTLITFTNILGNASTPSIVHRDILNDLTTASSNSPRPLPRYIRVKYVTTDVSGSSSFTGKIRISANKVNVVD